jgi:hypothetical protein
LITVARILSAVAYVEQRGEMPKSSTRSEWTIEMSEAATETVSFVEEGSATSGAAAAPDQAIPRLSPRAGLEFFRDFARFAGWKGARCALLIVLGALFENVGLVMLIPFLALTMDVGAAGARVEVVATAIFRGLHAETRVTRLIVLLAILASLLVLRAIVISARARLTGELRIGFVEKHRRNILHRLAATSWERVLKLRHARVTQVMGGDIDHIGTLAVAHWLANTRKAAVSSSVNWTSVPAYTALTVAK